MSARVLFVSVNQTFDPRFTLAELEPWVAQAWAMTVAKAESCDRVVAVHQGVAVGAWRLRGAYPTEWTYSTTGGDRPRIALSLGEALPVLSAYSGERTLRRGSATDVLEVEALAPEREVGV